MATKKAPTKKVAAKRTAAKQTTARKPAATPTPADQIADQFSDVRDFVRNVVHTSVGIPFVLQSRLGELPNFDMPKFDIALVTGFLGEAERQGSARVAALQSRIEPVAASIQVRLDGFVDKVEAPLPGQLRDVLADTRKRVRQLVAA